MILTGDAGEGAFCTGAVCARAYELFESLLAADLEGPRRAATCAEREELALNAKPLSWFDLELESPVGADSLYDLNSYFAEGPS